MNPMDYLKQVSSNTPKEDVLFTREEIPENYSCDGINFKHSTVRVFIDALKETKNNGVCVKLMNALYELQYCNVSDEMENTYIALMSENEAFTVNKSLNECYKVLITAEKYSNAMVWGMMLGTCLIVLFVISMCCFSYCIHFTSFIYELSSDFVYWIHTWIVIIFSFITCRLIDNNTENFSEGSFEDLRED
jgi:hypothetical protein